MPPAKSGASGATSTVARSSDRPADGLEVRDPEGTLDHREVGDGLGDAHVPPAGDHEHEQDEREEHGGGRRTTDAVERDQARCRRAHPPHVTKS